jgi:AmmeMemoRadiSam system protein B
VATSDPAILHALGRACAQAITATSGPQPLIVASSDMTHYEPAAAARRKDTQALQAVIDVDAEALLRVVAREAITMCGVAPTAAMLFAAREIGPCQGAVISYATSGDVTGDTDEVVGYAAAVVRRAA